MKSIYYLLNHIYTPWSEILTELYVIDISDNLSYNKSTSEYLFILANSTITWTSKKQSFIVSSTTEAEYITYSKVAKEVAWL